MKNKLVFFRITILAIFVFSYCCDSNTEMLFDKPVSAEPLNSTSKEFKSTDKSIIFKHRIIDSSPPSGSDCCLDILSIGDIDGDGRVDIMVGSEFSEGLVWYNYPSWTRYVIGSGDYTTDGEIADIDRDGDGDVVISCKSRDAIEWWENKGDLFKKEKAKRHSIESFSRGTEKKQEGQKSMIKTLSWTPHTIGHKFSHDLAIGDINGDDCLDVVVFKTGKERQVAWFQAPKNPREKWTRHEIDAIPGEGLDIGDIDGDGDFDLAASKKWYENVDGHGLDWKTHMIFHGWGERCRDIIADINRDGKVDIVLSHSEGSGRLSWFENPNWTEHKIEAGLLHGAHSLEVGDFNKDGWPDVFTGEMHTSDQKRVLLYINLGGGTSWEKITLAKTGTHNARIGDVGGDGDLDIVGKNYNGPKVIEMWENMSKSLEYKK